MVFELYVRTLIVNFLLKNIVCSFFRNGQTFLYSLPIRISSNYSMFTVKALEKKDHKNNCGCDLTYGDCRAKLDWTIERLR